MISQPQPAASSRLRTLTITILGLAIGLFLDYFIFRILFAHPSNDQSWLLYAAQRMLEGTQIYGPKLVETNPPLILWFSVVVVWFSRFFHTGPILFLQELVSVLIVLSTVWVVRLLRVSSVAKSAAISWFAFAATLAIEASAIPMDFAQREHLLVLLLLPYLLAAVSNAEPKLGIAERIALGVAGGLGICLKPQLAIVIVGFELSLALWNRGGRRLFRPELLALIFTGVAYMACVLLATPQYFHQLLPILRDTYWAIGTAPDLLLLRGEIPYYLGCLAVLLVWLWRRPTLQVLVAPIALLVCSLCASVAYFTQHTELTYHAIPQKAFLYYAAAWLAIEALSPLVDRLKPGQVSRRSLALSVLAFVLLFSPVFALRGLHNERSLKQQTFEQQVLSHCPPGTHVYILSTDPSGLRDVFRDHLVWSSRYNHLWILPAIILNEDAEAGGPPARKMLPPARVQQLARLLRNNVTDDLRSWKPVIVLVSRCTPTHDCEGFRQMQVDELAWFLRDPAFAAEWGHYRLQQSDRSADLYARKR